MCALRTIVGRKSRLSSCRRHSPLHGRQAVHSISFGVLRKFEFSSCHPNELIHSHSHCRCFGFARITQQEQFCTCFPPLIIIYHTTSIGSTILQPQEIFRFFCSYRVPLMQRVWPFSGSVRCPVTSPDAGLMPPQISTVGGFLHFWQFGT